MNDVSTRALLGITHGPADGGKGKAADEQKLLDEAMEAYPRLFAKERLWTADRNFPGAARLPADTKSRNQTTGLKYLKPAALRAILAYSTRSTDTVLVGRQRNAAGPRCLTGLAQEASAAATAVYDGFWLLSSASRPNPLSTGGDDVMSLHV